MTVAEKQPTVVRDPIIPKLVIQDLVEMDKTGNFDLNVLLWLQDRYTNQAIKENRDDLRDLHQRLVKESVDPDESRRIKSRAIIEYTRETYSAEKGDGRGADLKTYLEAAETFYQTESARYGAHLQEIAEYIKKALENGEQPDVEKYARHAYVSMAKISGAMDKLENLSGKAMAQVVLNTMKKGIEEIHFAAVGDQPAVVGRQMLKLVDHISVNPRRYIEFRDPASMATPKMEAWDLEPMHRNDRSIM